MVESGFTEEEQTRIEKGKEIAASFGLESVGPGEGQQPDEGSLGFWKEHPVTKRLAGYLAEKLVGVRERNDKAAIGKAIASGSILPEFVAMDVLKCRGHAEALEHVLRAIADIGSGTLTRGKI